jgi:hypothetical protein
VAGKDYGKDGEKHEPKGDCDHYYPPERNFDEQMVEVDHNSGPVTPNTYEPPGEWTRKS